MAIAAYERALQLDPANESTTNIDEISHAYTHCAICFNRIIGIRSRCLKCDDFDLCSACSVERVESHPSDHLFVTIPMDKLARKSKFENYLDVDMFVCFSTVLSPTYNAKTIVAVVIFQARNIKACTQLTIRYHL